MTGEFLRRPADRGCYASSRLVTKSHYSVAMLFHWTALPYDMRLVRSIPTVREQDLTILRQVKNLAVMPWNDHYITTPNYLNHADKGDFI